MALCRLVELHLHYMRQKIEGPMQKGIDEVGPDCCDNIIRIASKAKLVTLEDAAPIQEKVVDSLLQEHQQKAILEAIDKKVQELGNGSSNKTELRFPELYQSKGCWDVYNAEVSVDLRLMAAAKRFRYSVV